MGLMDYDDVAGTQLSYLLPGAEVVLRADYGDKPRVGSLVQEDSHRIALRLPVGARATVRSVSRTTHPTWSNVVRVKGATFELHVPIEYEVLADRGRCFVKQYSTILVTDGFQATFWRPLPEHPWWNQWER